MPPRHNSFEALLAARNEAAFRSLPGYAPPPEFKPAEWTRIAQVPAVSDGRPVTLYEARWPARFFRLDVAESAKGPAFSLRTGSGDGAFAAQLAQAIAGGDLTVKFRGNEPPARGILRQAAHALQDTLAGVTPATSLREVLQTVLQELARPASTSPLFAAARAFLHQPDDDTRAALEAVLATYEIDHHERSSHHDSGADRPADPGGSPDRGDPHAVGRDRLPAGDDRQPADPRHPETGVPAQAAAGGAVPGVPDGAAR